MLIKACILSRSVRFKANSVKTDMAFLKYNSDFSLSFSDLELFEDRYSYAKQITMLMLAQRAASSQVCCVYCHSTIFMNDDSR